MTQKENELPCEKETDFEWQGSNSLDVLRNAGCESINHYLPGYKEGADQTEVFSITKDQFDRAFDLEWIRRGRPQNSVVAALYHETDRLKGELSRVGIMIDAAVSGYTRNDEPLKLRRRLDMVRSLAYQLNLLKGQQDLDKDFI